MASVSLAQSSGMLDEGCPIVPHSHFRGVLGSPDSGIAEEGGGELCSGRLWAWEFGQMVVVREQEVMFLSTSTGGLYDSMGIVTKT